MHGLGSDEQDMFGLAQELPENLEIHCLRAPLPYGPGYSWFDIQWSPAGIRFERNQFESHVDLVADYARQFDPTNLIIGGFSQGCMMTVGLMYSHPDLFSSAVLLSGRGISDQTPDFKGKVFHAHGTYDEVIAVEFAYGLKKSLISLGDHYEFHEYEMGHSICLEEVDALNNWISRREPGELLG
jgi:phospholipase/carboxylesterase